MFSPEYKYNKESSEDMVAKLVERFKTRGDVMPPEQRNIYEKISQMATGMVVLDIGSGLGIGANILSTEARFTWGIDKEQGHVDFANKMFRRKNTTGLGQLEFEQLDLVNPPSREFSKFHIIVCVDVLEHIEDYEKAINTIKRFYNSGKTTLFISTPNRNAEKFKDNQNEPWNPHHVREWSIGEAYDILIHHFSGVTCLSWDLESPQELDSKVTPVVFKCEGSLL